MLPKFLQLETKNIYKSHDDNNYQHDSYILISYIYSNTTKHNTQMTNQQHFHNNRTRLWNRLINPGVWSKINFMSRLRSPLPDSNHKILLSYRQLHATTINTKTNY